MNLFSSILLVILSVFFVYGQENKPLNSEIKEVYFSANKNQKFGFDKIEFEEWSKHYSNFKLNDKKQKKLSYKSVGKKETDLLDFVVKTKQKTIGSKFRFFDKNEEIKFVQKNDTLFTLYLPKRSKNYYISAYFNQVLLDRISIKIFSLKKEKVILVPIKDFRFDAKKVQKNLNSIFKQANVEIELTVAEQFKSKVFKSETIFGNPNSKHENYTGQMRLLRDLYFESNPNVSKKANYIFLINGFIDTNCFGYMVQNKALGFIVGQENESHFIKNLAQTVAFGFGSIKESWSDFGPSKGSTSNLMDLGKGIYLNFFQWEQIRGNEQSFSFFDNDENIKTNNGTVGYFFWEEDLNGNIIFNENVLNSIKRPYKKNFVSYRFNVEYIILKPFFKYGKYYFSTINLVFLCVIILLFLFVKKKIKAFWHKKEFKKKFWRRLFYFPILFCFGYFTFESMNLSNLVLDQFKIVTGPVPELNSLNYKQAKKELLINANLRHKEEYSLCSEILINKNQSWSVKKRKKVLYFEIKQNSKNGKINQFRFVSNSDSVVLDSKKYKRKAYAHYMVFSFFDENGKLVNQDLYNHLGVNINNQIHVKDIPKRILVFVNGYRPTSIGKTFEENFTDIKKNGLEYPNSKNLIYNFDRYDYWEQWNQINLMLQNRINPSETYYADGHFSVSTSNHKSLFNFTSLSSLYPKRCQNPKNHQCYTWKTPSLKDRILNDSKTINQLKLRSNKKGFRLRKKKGQLAGRNLLQILNDVPNLSSNDTLFLVAHSMGFAYSLGIVEELRGKINFGGFYIIAPENAKTGKVNELEWQEIWQYGSNFNKHEMDAPCLQDGVAPQSKVAGLSSKNRIYIPKSLYHKKGFFDSHFIGYYNWILKIPAHKKGYIKQH